MEMNTENGSSFLCQQFGVLAGILIVMVLILLPVYISIAVCGEGSVYSVLCWLSLLVAAGLNYNNETIQHPRVEALDQTLEGRMQYGNDHSHGQQAKKTS